MDYMGTKLEDIIVTLPFEDGTSLECGVHTYFKVNGKAYFAMLPLKGKKQLDYSKNYMIYEVKEDKDHNPEIFYIESDEEYAVVAQHFSDSMKDGIGKSL